MLTPVERHAGHLVKRDDLFQVNGVAGGKVRTCQALAEGAVGLVTAGARHSPQISIVSRIAQEMGVPAVCITAPGPMTDELRDAEANGAEVIRSKVGYSTVLASDARHEAERRGWTLIPFGMEHQAAVDQTATQVANVIEANPARIVMPVGSGMSLAGVLTGLDAAGSGIPVLGVVVGADPVKRLAKYAPVFWTVMAELVPAGVDYQTAVDASLGEIVLDPIYEAKCHRFLEDGDLLWIVGVRATLSSRLAHR